MTVLLIVILLTISFSFYIYRVTFYASPKHRPPFDAPLVGIQYEPHAEHIHRICHAMERYPCEEITIHAFDGTALFGRYYHLKDGAPIMILFHGYRSHPFRDCSGSHALSRKLGLNALVIDQRSQGNSDGHTITFGILERKDCRQWADYAAHRFGKDVPIILSGLSMGAATVLMASDLNLPSNVCCIVADSPYSSPINIIQKVAADRHYPVALCKPFLYFSAWIWGGFLLNSSSAKESVRHARVPILLIHGEDDLLVPSGMSLEIAANCASRVQVVTFPQAGHGLSHLTDPVRYEQAIINFFHSIPVLSDYLNGNVANFQNDA